MQKEAACLNSTKKAKSSSSSSSLPGRYLPTESSNPWRESDSMTSTREKWVPILLVGSLPTIDSRWSTPAVSICCPESGKGQETTSKRATFKSSSWGSAGSFVCAYYHCFGMAVMCWRGRRHLSDLSCKHCKTRVQVRENRSELSK